MGKAKNILLIDDEPPILQLLSKALDKRGHHYETAENGRLGFRIATTRSFDLIICDLQMPEWNGIESIKGILMVKPESKFLVLSGYAENVVADEIRNLDCVLAVMSKPAEINELMEYVENC